MAKVILNDNFIDANNTALNSHIPSIYPSSSVWTQTASNSFQIENNQLVSNRMTDGDLAIIESTLCDFSAIVVMTPYSDGGGQCFPAFVFRYQDSSNFWYVQLDINKGIISVYDVVAGSQNVKIQYVYSFTSGTPVTLQVDCKGQNITITANGVEIVTLTSSDFLIKSQVGFRFGKRNSPASSCIFNSLQITTYNGNLLNWPIFTPYSSNPLIVKGGNGAYDSNDCNDPNIAYDAIHNRYVMYYSAYSGSGDQTTGIAYAPTPLGPWTKETHNPVFNANTTGYSEDGGLAYFKGKWYKTHGLNNDKDIGLAVSQDLITWINEGVILTHDTTIWEANGIAGSFLRVTEDGNTLQVWYTSGTGSSNSPRAIGLATSTDGINFIKSSLNPVLTQDLNLYYNVTTGDFGSVSVWCPPGKEGQEYLITVDSNQITAAVRRGLSQFISLDGMKTWHSRYQALSGGGSGNWDSNQRIDSNPFYDPIAQILYLFFAGCNTDGPTVNLNAEVGVATAPFPFTSLDGSKNSALKIFSNKKKERF